MIRISGWCDVETSDDDLACLEAVLGVRCNGMIIEVILVCPVSLENGTGLPNREVWACTRIYGVALVRIQGSGVVGGIVVLLLLLLMWYSFCRKHHNFGRNLRVLVGKMRVS